MLQFAGMTLPLPGPQNAPAEQGRQDDTLLACVAELYVPALQLVGMALPGPGPQNAPVGQGRQAATVTDPSSVLYVPAAH